MGRGMINVHKSTTVYFWSIPRDACAQNTSSQESLLTFIDIVVVPNRFTGTK